MDDLTRLLPILLAATNGRGPGRRELARVFLAQASRLKGKPDQLWFWADQHGGLWIQEKDADRAIEMTFEGFGEGKRTRP